MRAAFAAVALCLLAAAAQAHNGVVHATPAEAASHAAEPLPAVAGLPFLVDLGGEFTLTDHAGAPRTQMDPGGRMQLVFFGYANCTAICSVALPLMAEVVDGLAARDIAVTPVLITVDPARDTVATMAAPLAELHPDFVGLTGTEAELAPVYDLFSVAHSKVFEDPETGPVYAHGSHIYLLDPQGGLLTLVPPILATDRLTDIVAAYAEPGT